MKSSISITAALAMEIFYSQKSVKPKENNVVLQQTCPSPSEVAPSQLCRWVPLAGGEGWMPGQAPGWVLLCTLPCAIPRLHIYFSFIYFLFF